MLTLAFASVDTFADEVSPNEGLLGDWGGLRTRLYQQGVDFQLGYTTELAYNAQGGDSDLLRNADQLIWERLSISKRCWAGRTPDFKSPLPNAAATI